MNAPSSEALSHQTHGVVRLERDGECLVVVIDNPPVNVCSHEVRVRLLAAIEALGNDPSLRCGVVIGAGRGFVSGSDIKEFGSSLREPTLPVVLAAIENCAKPIVAAIRGVALGGGFELSLACDRRIATSNAVVGLPEVKLGLIPGAGGTQRVPRLVGIAAAIDMVTSGRRIPALEALRLGLVDDIVDGDLRAVAVAQASSLNGRKRRLKDVAVPDSPPDGAEAAAAAALKRAKGRPYLRAAVEAVRSAALIPFDEGLARERLAFEQLRSTEESAALRYLFFAEREASRLPWTEKRSLYPIRKVGIVGAGTMGSRIAVACLEAGFDVTLVDKDRTALAAGQGRLRETISRGFASSRVSQEDPNALLNRLTASTELAAVGACDLVIEAVFDDLDVKCAIMRRLDAVLPPQAILATNTSYLDVERLAAATNRPELVVGLHFFNPAHIMRLLEIVEAPQTSRRTLATCFAFARSLGKIAVLAGAAEGFIGNRIYNAYRTQCEFMLEEGALPHEVDDAMEAFGFAMGPFRVGDLSGLDIAWSYRKRVHAVLDPRIRAVHILERLCEAGRFGAKSGAGWYAYPNGARRGVIDPVTRGIIEAESARKGIVRRHFHSDEIVDRALGAIVNEAALVLHERVAQRPSDVDVVMVHGYGFSDYRGGPMYWASRCPHNRVTAAIDAVERAAGFGFRRADLRIVTEAMHS